MAVEQRKDTIDKSDWVATELDVKYHDTGWGVDNYTYENNPINNLYELYRTDKLRARIHYMNEANKEKYSKRSIMLFEDPKSKDFDVVIFVDSCGISVTNRIYKNSKREQTIRYREKTGFWFSNSRGVSRLSYMHINQMMRASVIHEFFKERFAWYKAIYENDLSVSKDLTFHKIWKHKLYSLDKLLKAYYGVPIQAARVLHEFKTKQRKSGRMISSGHKMENLQYYKRWLSNIENISMEMLDKDWILFYDSVKMAKVLDKKLNCSWGIKRLKEEHDNWAEMITDNLLFVDDRDLKVKDEFLLFAEFSGYEIIKTTRDLVLEGKRRAHCVGTYAERVDRGTSGIYSIGDYTLELHIRHFEKRYADNNQNPNEVQDNSDLVWREDTTFSRWVDEKHDECIGEIWDELHINQFRGFANEVVTDELRDEVIIKLEEFNKKMLHEGKLRHQYIEIVPENDRPQTGSINLSTQTTTGASMFGNNIVLGGNAITVTGADLGDNRVFLQNADDDIDNLLDF
jgi:hypothetical protein